MSRGTNYQNLKESHTIISEIIDATDGRRTDGRRTNFDFMSSADIVKELNKREKRKGRLKAHSVCHRRM